MQRRDFLIRSGFALGASATAGLLQRPAVASPQPIGPVDREASDWAWVRDQFSLSRDYVHLAGFLLASHPSRVAQAIETHRRRLDENPADYWHENMGRFEADARSAAAQYLATSPELIALTDSTTMGLGLIYGSLTLKPGQEILSTVHDHYSTDMSLRHRAKRTGTTLRRIPLYRDIKNVSVDEIVHAIVGALTPRTRIVAVTWVHSSTGLKLPIRAIADALAEVNAQRDPDERALLCVDGVHGFGVEDVTMDKLGCDFFIAGTHKWMFGPRGTGIICGRPEAWEAANVIIPSFEMQTYGIWLGRTEPQQVPGGIAMTPGGFHSFEHRWALGEAFRFHLQIGKPRVEQRIHSLNRQAKAGLVRMPHVTLHTPQSDELSAGIICFEVDGVSPPQVVKRLHEKRIIASSSPYATSYARLAPSLLNDAEEIDLALREIRAMG